MVSNVLGFGHKTHTFYREEHGVAHLGLRVDLALVFTGITQLSVSMKW
jgi:hypothetical protein